MVKRGLRIPPYHGGMPRKSQVLRVGNPELSELDSFCVRKSGHNLIRDGSKRCPIHFGYNELQQAGVSVCRS